MTRVRRASPRAGTAGVLSQAGAAAWGHHVSRIAGHRPGHSRRIQHALLVHRQLPEVAEVLDVQVWRLRADEHRLLLERDRVRVWRPNRHHDHRPGCNSHGVLATGETQLAPGDDEDLLVLMMDVLR